MQKSFFSLALIFFIPLFSYLAARVFVYEKHRDFYCNAEISEITVFGKKGSSERLKGWLIFDLKNNEINMSFYNVDTLQPSWRGVIKIAQEYDFWGVLKSIKIINVNQNISSKNIQEAKEQIPSYEFFKGADIPLRIYKVNNKKGVYFFKYASHIGFCVNEF